jgi:hypothetical protein
LKGQEDFCKGPGSRDRVNFHKILNRLDYLAKGLELKRRNQAVTVNRPESTALNKAPVGDDDEGPGMFRRLQSCPAESEHAEQARCAALNGYNQIRRLV